MNELLNYLNNYAKNRKNKQRVSAIMVCLAIIVSFTVSVGLIEPAESASGELICGMEEHEHTQDCFELICGFDEETEEEIVVETTLSDSEETMESTTSTEEITTAATEPATTETIISTCTDESVPAPVHIHNDECYRLICLTEAHLHKQDCYNQPAETEPAAIETSTSTSTGTDTTATTEQTTETTTTTTELSEEVYELNPALFGELYKDRVNILADDTIKSWKETTDNSGNKLTVNYIEEYKFYYKDKSALYVSECFDYNESKDHSPEYYAQITQNVTVHYNNSDYYVYNLNNAGRFISFTAPENGKLIFVLNSDAYTINLSVNGNEDENLVFTNTGEPNIIEISVAKGNTYTIKQAEGEGKARLAYAEFIPAVKTEEYKFYYDDEKILHYNECFSYPDGTDGPNANTVTPNLEVVYNGNTYTNTYNFNKTEARYITLTAPQNGTLLLVFDGGNYNINVLKTGDTEPKSYSCNNSDQNVIAVPVVANGEYKIYQNANDTYNARLAYAEFVPTFTKEEIADNLDKTYRIRNVKTGLYVEMDNYGNIIQGSNKPSGDMRNDFKFSNTRNAYYQILPQRDTSKAVDYSKNDKDFGTYRIKTLSADGDNSLKNQEFNLLKNTDGTYKIYTRYDTDGNFSDNAYCWEISENGTIVNAAKDTTNLSQDFIFVEATEIIFPKADLDTGNPYLLRNVRSRQFVHKEAKVEIKDANGNVTQTLYNQIIQQKDIGTDSQFKFVPTGVDGEYYIVSGDSALTSSGIGSGADVDYSDFTNSDNQKFYAEKMDDDSVRFYQINNGVKYYLGVKDKSINSGAQFELKEADRVNDYQCFFIVPVVAPEEVPEANTRVEARVIFADYNDGKIDDNTRNLYDEPAWIPTFSLYKNGNLEENQDGNLVVDVSSARKDWCYQYNYVWNLGESNTDNYYVALNGVNNNQITLNGKTFNVYYLKDTELGHPGYDADGNLNAPDETYKQDPSAYNQTGDQIIYIFLDPVVEQWWGGTNPPATFDLSMKKRWDGHNASGYDNRPKEKIKIQLQRLKDGKWVEYNSENFPDDNYDFSCYFEVVDADGENKMYVHKDAVGNATDIYRVLNNDGTVSHYEVRNGATTTIYEKEYFDYETLSSKGWLTDNNNYRFNLHLEEREWNNVVLTVDGNNNPTHFTNGYYFNWKAIPYGNYRVIETQSFYDANENDVFDEGDRDTSNEYYYMSYPPMRDSKGVLHIQNFTKDMVLDIQKKWYDDTGTVDVDNPGKTVKVNIYRSLEKLSDPSVAKLGVPIYSDVEVTGDNVILKTTAGYDKLLLKTTSEQKYYYYIQEVSVDGFLLLNGNDEGFVKSTNGNYYVDYEDGDGRKFIIENKAKIGIKLNKEWYDTENDANNNTNKMTFAEGSEPNAEFEIYMSDRLGTPLYSNGEFKVEYEYYTDNRYTAKATQTLTRIADAKIDKNGQFEIYSGEENKGEGTSKVISDQLHIFGDEEVFNGEKTFEADATTKGVFEPQNAPWQKEDDYYLFSDGERLYVKPRHGFGGVIELTFTDISENDVISWRQGSNDYDLTYLSKHEDYEEGKDLTIRFYMNDGDDKGLRNRTDLKEESNPKLKSAVFYPYNYYYIREKTSDTCELINGDSNGFVVLQDTDKYYLNLSADSDETRFPIVTAKNIPKVNLNITKEWTSSNAEISKVMDFEIYKAFAQGTPVADGEGYKVTVNDADYQLTKLSSEYKTDENGNLNVADLAAFEKDSDGKYHKLYYYVRETDGNYTITNTDAKNGFIPYESEKYGTAFDDTSSNSGKYKFTNTPKLDITVNKKWLDEKGNEDINKAKTEIKFELYRKIENGEFMPVPENGTGYVTSGLKKVIEGLDAYDENGNIYTYYIKEIDGETYYISGFNVKYNNQTNPEECAFSWNKDDEIPVINITNQAKPQNYELPETGGSGTHGCTAAGGTIVLLSAAALLLKCRKKVPAK